MSANSSNFTDAYDLILTRLAALYPSHTRLYNAYVLEDNDDLYLKQGYGIKVGPAAVNTQRSLGKVRSTEVNYTVVFARRMAGRDHDPEPKSDTEQTLLGDVQTLIDDIHENNLNLGETNIAFVGFSGVETVRPEELKYLFIEVNMTVEYFIQ